jgi:hypothetical protein
MTLRREYSDETEIPSDLRQHYQRDDATGKFVLAVEEPKPPAPPPVRYRTDLKTPADRARYCKENGAEAYLSLPAAEEGKPVTDKAQFSSNAERQDFIHRFGQAAFDRLPDSRVQPQARR